MLLAREGKRATLKCARELFPRSCPREITSPEADLLGNTQSLAQEKEHKYSVLGCLVGEGKNPTLALSGHLSPKRRDNIKFVKVTVQRHKLTQTPTYSKNYGMLPLHTAYVL